MGLADPSLPSRFGPFELLERIAEGGMAEIFRARHEALKPGEDLVIKRLLPHLATNRTLIDLLTAEGRITALLSHPNIVEVLEHGHIGGRHYICLEYLDGPDLLALLTACTRRDQAMPVDLALHVVRILCEALDHAHHARDPFGQPLHIIHRDISPSNVLLTREARIKLMDFGVARAELGLTAPERERGGLRGKLGYMAPEQVESRPFDQRADLFALGVLLFEMLTLKRLFVGRTEVQTLMNIRECAVEDRLARHPYIPAAVAELLRGALARDPVDRLPSARAFAAAIDAIAPASRHQTTALRQLVAQLLSPAHDLPDASLTPLPHVEEEQGPPAMTSQIHFRNRDGSLFGPIPAASLPALATEYALHPDDLLTLDGADFRRLRDIPELCRSFPALLADLPRAPLLEGALQPISVATLFLHIARDRLTGCLRLTARDGRKHLFFQEGRPIAAFSTLKTDLFGAWLVASGRLPEAALIQTLADPALARLPLGQRLVASGVLTDADLSLALAEHLEARLREALSWQDGWYAFVTDESPPRSCNPELSPDLVRLVVELNAVLLSNGALEILMAPYLNVPLRPGPAAPTWLLSRLTHDAARIARYLLTAGGTLAACPGPLHNRLRVAMLLRNAGLLSLSPLPEPALSEAP